MPLRDHFHPPLRGQSRWEGFHSQWISILVRALNLRLLPSRFRSEPNLRLGALVQVDVASVEQEESLAAVSGLGNGIGLATEVWAPPRPPQTYSIDFAAQDIFEVRILDEIRGSRLVAAIELVSPANKDRPANRQAFAVKCAAYLQQNVSVIVVDAVTERQDSLHAELMQLLGLSTEDAPGPLYAIAYRTTKENETWRLDVWPETLTVGARLPVLPLWLASDLAIALELESTYEETCRELRLS